MDYESIKIEGGRLARQIYTTIAEKRNGVLLETGELSLANAFAIETASELISIVMACSMSPANGQSIDNDFKKIYYKFHESLGKIVEETMLENGLQVLRVDVPIEKKEGP